MLAIFSANVVSHYSNLMVPILQLGAQRFWLLEFLVKLRTLTPRIERVIRTPHHVYACYISAPICIIYLHALRWLRYLMLPLFELFFCFSFNKKFISNIDKLNHIGKYQKGV